MPTCSFFGHFPTIMTHKTKNTICSLTGRARSPAQALCGSVRLLTVPSDTCIRAAPLGGHILTLLAPALLPCGLHPGQQGLRNMSWM